MVGTKTKRTKTRQMMKRRELKQEMCCEAFRQELSVYEREEPNRGEVTGRRHGGGRVRRTDWRTISARRKVKV